MRIKQICDLTGLSRASIYALEKAGKFPGKVALGARAVAWRESTVAKWMAERESAVKTDKEAKPGTPPTKKSSAEPAEESSASSVPNKKGKKRSSTILSEPQDDGWSQGEPISNEEEMAAVRAKLAQRAKGPFGTGNRSGLTAGARAPGASPEKNTQGKVTVLAGSSLRKKAP
ncbi:MAG: AlpA family phage regulatory protein [Sulfuritalea sp.]